MTNLFALYLLLYSILRVYKYTREHNQLIMTTSITNEYTSLYKSLTLYFRKGYVCCVWEMSGDKERLLYWSKFFLDHSSTSFASWLGLLNHGLLRAQSPLSAAGSHFGNLSPTDSNRPGTWLYYFLRPPASAVLPLIYIGASLDWRLGRWSIYNTTTILLNATSTSHGLNWFGHVIYVSQTSTLENIAKLLIHLNISWY